MGDWSGSGIRCPNCGSDDYKTVDSRPSVGSIRRRLRCQACGEKVTTYERIETDEPPVVTHELAPEVMALIDAAVERAADRAIKRYSHMTAMVRAKLRADLSRERAAQQAGQEEA
jgi:transcriptional regulator NrdR family protein